MSEQDDTTDVKPASGRKILLGIPKYLGAYLLGIAACIIATPAEWDFGRFPFFFLLYPILSVPFFFLWPFMVFQESTYLYRWWMWLIALTPVAGEGIAFLASRPRVRAWRPLWFGFPIGFVGSFTVYWACVLSI